MVWTRAVSFLVVAVLGCGGEQGPPPRPDAPAEADPEFVVQGAKGWYLVGNALTAGDEVVAVSVSAPGSVDRVWAWVGDREAIELAPSGDGFALELAVDELGIGEHEILLSADRAAVGFATVPVSVSHPLYVVVSVDWDRADAPDDMLQRHLDLHEWHPELKITHFLGPYTFTATVTDDARRAEIAAWMQMMRDDYGDEIGLHIHPYCNFVDTTSVPCRHEPSTVYPEGDEVGYTVMCAAYTEEEFTVLLEAADALFEANGLGKPTSFRAGGWTADLSTLRALVNAGYVVDTSANNWTRMEEWMNYEGATLYQWNMETWATIDDTSQPYYPSESDLLSSEQPVLPILEVPDNGILVDYVTEQEMIDIFDANFDGTPLAEPTVYQIGFHSNNFYMAYRDRIDVALTHADQYLASEGMGPVVYVNISDLVEVWPVPQ